MENDLEKMKKTMPYTVPDGFFDMMEERLKQETEAKKEKKKEKSNLRKVALWTGFAVAASLALLIVVRQLTPKSDENSFEQVETAFNQLSDADQEIMFDYYDEIEYYDNY